jgi:hypothetical protein
MSVKPDERVCASAYMVSQYVLWESVDVSAMMGRKEVVCAGLNVEGFDEAWG